MKPSRRLVFAGILGVLLLGVYEDLGLLVAALAGVWLVFDPPAKAKYA
jgi:hypothetical protein